MNGYRMLGGSCSCGRNRYMISIPETATHQAEVYFDSGRDHRRSQGAPITAWLRVPLTWYQSNTQSFYPDESHSAIRRTFTPLHDPHSQRNFCGFCGTPLTYWTELPREEADYMSVSIGSLYGEAQRMLEDLNLLPGDVTEPLEELEGERGVVAIPRSPSASATSPPDFRRSYRRGTVSGIPWFEELIEGSRLGRLLKTRRGMGVSHDQGTTIEWEISEWHDDGAGAETGTDSSSSSVGGAGKRKRDRATSNPEEIRSSPSGTEIL
ncbi:hypothetical protein VTN02DRAFT_2988 [Thermoascus thermophilus]